MTEIAQELDRLVLDANVKHRILHWLEGDFDSQSKDEILQLIKTNPQKLIDSFYTTLEFGTGGLRGIMGPGTNRMNTYTVAWATQGLANYLKKVKKTSISCAIGYDSRHNSKEFALVAASVLAGNDITVHIFPILHPTPLVSFACRYYHCDSGIMITASHNPKEYNGYKVYWDDGSQVLPPHDVGIIEEVKKIQDMNQVKKAPDTSPKIQVIPNEVNEAYFKAIEKLRLWQSYDQEVKNSVKAVYTSLHGTGITMFPKACEIYGYKSIQYVEKQIIPDGDFPTTVKPNPEEKQALELGIQQLKRENADLLLANDPDADRLGIVVLHKGEPHILTGDQIAAIFSEFILVARKSTKRRCIVKSIVTTELVRAITIAHGASCIDVLPGFKYIAEKIRQWENTDNEFYFGCEESYGYLDGTYVRDKDAISADMLALEIAYFAKQQKKTLIDFLYELYEKFGFFYEEVVSLNFEEGQKGKEKMSAIMQNLRKTPPTSFASIPCQSFTDYENSFTMSFEKNTKINIDFAKSNIVEFILQDGSKIIIRPSGTEPKIKAYFMVRELCEPGIPNSCERAKIKAKDKAVLLQKSVHGLLDS